MPRPGENACCLTRVAAHSSARMNGGAHLLGGVPALGRRLEAGASGSRGSMSSSRASRTRFTASRSARRGGRSACSGERRWRWHEPSVMMPGSGALNSAHRGTPTVSHAPKHRHGGGVAGRHTRARVPANRQVGRARAGRDRRPARGRRRGGVPAGARARCAQRGLVCACAPAAPR
jgi:hypothetical protein